MNITKSNYLLPDNIGMASSTLCLIHCLATPFIFIVQTCTTSCCASTPLWWKAIDIVFLVVSFVAIYFAAKSANKKWVKVGFYSLFAILLVCIANEYLAFLFISKYIMYTAAGLLASLHLYNRHTCKCTDAHCATKASKGNAFYTKNSKLTIQL